jgi:membrane protein
MLKIALRLEDLLFVRSADLRAPWGPLLRVLRYPVALLRDWIGGEITVRAMSLAYTTLLSIVPLLAFAFAILKLIGAHASIGLIVFEFLRPLGDSAAHELTESVLQFVRNLRGDVLGTVGFASLAYTVFTTIRKVEACFHFIWRVEVPRSLLRRTAEYAIAMFAGPLLIAAGLALLALAKKSPIEQWTRAIMPADWTLSLAGRLLPYAIVTLAFTAMYAFVPNTPVRPRAALIGGISAGIVWALVGKAFTAFIVYSSHLLAVYTSFTIVLTTLIWIYLSWLILMLGAQLSFYVQHPQYLRHGQSPIELSTNAREQVVLSIMVLVAQDHAAANRAWSADRLAAALGLPLGALLPVLAGLEQARLLRALSPGAFVLGAEPEKISLAAIVAAARDSHSSRLSVAVRSAPGCLAVIDDIDAAVKERLAERTLRDLLAASPAAAPAASLAGDRQLVD